MCRLLGHAMPSMDASRQVLSEGPGSANAEPLSQEYVAGVLVLMQVYSHHDIRL